MNFFTIFTFFETYLYISFFFCLIRKEKIVFLIRKMFLLLESINKLFLFKFNKNKPTWFFLQIQYVLFLYIPHCRLGPTARKLRGSFLFFLLTCSDIYLSAHSAARRQKGLNVCFMGQKVLTVFAPSGEAEKKNCPIKIQTNIEMCQSAMLHNFWNAHRSHSIFK